MNSNNMNDKTMTLKSLPAVMTVLQDVASPLPLLASANSFALTRTNDRMMEADRAGLYFHSALNGLSVTDCSAHNYLPAKSELQSVADVYDDESGDGPLYAADSFETCRHAAYACNVARYGNFMRAPCYDNSEGRAVFNSWGNSRMGYGCVLCHDFLHACTIEGFQTTS